MVSEYMPDKWVVVKITPKDSSPLYKVFACWYGGWDGADSWKLNSGIVRVNDTDASYVYGSGFYEFEGSSGSLYICGKQSYGTNLYGQGVLNNLIDKIERSGGICEILPEETNFLELKYE